MPISTPTFRWGVLGAGAIAARFARDLSHVPGATVAGIYARRPEQAQAWLASAPAASGACVTADLDRLLSLPLDGVYLATLPDTHHGFARAALMAGHHVLCEKPVTRSLAELDDLLALAQARHLLFMEAMKTPFLPAYRALRSLLGPGPMAPAAGVPAIMADVDAEAIDRRVRALLAPQVCPVLGAIRFVQAGNSSAITPPEHPSWSAALAGGALLSIGVYQAFLAIDHLGSATEVQALSRVAGAEHWGSSPALPRGGVLSAPGEPSLSPAVDAFTLLQSQHAQGFSQLFAGLELSSPGTATLSAADGFLTLAKPWWNPSRMSLHLLGKDPVSLDFPVTGDGLHYEAAHFAALVAAGPPRSAVWESPIVTHDHSRAVMHLLDRTRQQIGLCLGETAPHSGETDPESAVVHTVEKLPGQR